MFKKIIAIIILMAFCFMPMSVAPALAATDDMEAGTVKSGSVFNDNDQEIKDIETSVEALYNGRESVVSGRYLKQIGYNFSSSTATGSTSTGKFGSDYKLSLGDRINVLSYGASVDVMSMSGSNLVPPASQVTVGSNGSIFIPGIGLVRAENRTLGEVESDVNRIARSKFNNMNIKLTVSSDTTFSIFVYGEVGHPGKVYVSGNSSILDALGAAGGVKKSGSLRNISYNGKAGAIDLYNAILFGNDGNLILKANDRIFVPKIGTTSAVRNGVPKPGIYELKPGETMGDLIRYAGGFLVTTTPNEVVRVGFDPASGQKMGKTLLWKEAKNTKLANGDILEFRELYNGVENLVTLQGNIKHPSTYVWKEGMRLSDILKSEDELLEETFINQAVIRRISGDENTIETIPVFLKEFFAGMNDPVLMARDVVTVYRNTNSSFVDVYGCINNPKHIPYMSDMTLKDVLSDIKFMESDIKSDDNNEINTSHVDGDGKLKMGTDNTNKLIPTENVVVEITHKSGGTSIHYMYDLMIHSDKLKSIDIAPEDKIFFRTLRNDEVLKTVKISGYVKDPGVFTFVKGQNLSDVIKLAGGLTEDADLRGIVFKRNALQSKQANIALQNNEKDIELLRGKLATGYRQSEADQKNKADLIEALEAGKGSLKHRYNGQISLNINTNDINKISKEDNIEVQDGDDIYIPRISNHVSIIGEVYNEQSFIYKKGYTVRKYIKNVGGYTPNANRFRTYKVGVNGRAKKIHLTTKVYPGDTIIVPRKIPGNDWITPLASALQIVSQIFLIAFAVHKW